jgi:flagellar protein FliS
MNGYGSYERTSVETADPRAVIVLLYEGAIKFLLQAESALERKEKMEMSRLLNRTLKIITHLNVALDYERGGEVAVNLYRLYCYMRDCLLEANIRCDKSKIEEAINLFKTLLEAWRILAVDPEAAAALEVVGRKQKNEAVVKISTAPANENSEAVPQEAEIASAHQNRDVPIHAIPKALPVTVGTVAAARNAYGIH